MAAPPMGGDQHGSRVVLEHPSREVPASPRGRIRDPQGRHAGPGTGQHPRQIPGQAVVNGHSPSNPAAVTGGRHFRTRRSGSDDGVSRQSGGFQGLGDPLPGHRITGSGRIPHEEHSPSLPGQPAGADSGRNGPRLPRAGRGRMRAENRGDVRPGHEVDALAPRARQPGARAGGARRTRRWQRRQARERTRRSPVPYPARTTPTASLPPDPRP